ncbi:MAG: hypothetical protein IKO35_02360, partial [Elusimicrobiaceae bacterium]|nr:hypothetical protein [Elusimicrobiaceae bacterium]
NKKKSQSREERSLKNLIDNLIHDGKNRQLAAQSARMLSKFARVPHTPQQTLEAYNKFIQERNGKNPSRNSQDPVEKSLAVSIQHFALAGNPEDPAVQEIQRIHQESKTQRLPQQTLDEWQQFKQEHNGEKPSRYSEDPVERSLAISMEYYARHGNLADPVVQELKRVYREGMKEYRTPQRALEEYNQFKAEHNGERPSLSSKDPFEKALAISVYNFARKSNLADPAVQELRKIYQKEFPSRATISEVFDDFLAYVREFHAYPSAKEPLYNNIRSRIRRSPQPGNPDWDKLKQLDELVRSAQRGEVPWDVFDKANPLE